MGKLLGINGNIIIAILYVYYCEISGTEILEVWEPNPEFDFRRTPAKATTATDGNPEFRNKRHETAKYTQGYRAEIRHSVPKHTNKNGQSHLERIKDIQNDDQMMDDNQNSNNDQQDDRKQMNFKNHRMTKKNTEDINDLNIHHPDNRNKNRNHYQDQDDYTVRISHTLKDKNEDHHTNPHNNDKKQTNKLHPKNSDIYQNDKHQSNDKRQNAEKHQNRDKHHSYINDKNHGKDKTHDKDKTHPKDKPQAKNKNQPTDKNHDKDKAHAKDKNHEKDSLLGRGSQIRIPKLHSEEIRVRPEESKWAIHRHRAKLRTHKPRHDNDDDDIIRSTRMTPMYLMQQPPEEGEAPTTKKREEGEQAGSLFLSPYSIASQIKTVMEEFTDANVTIETIGRTVEYNDLVIVKMTEKKNEEGKYFRAAESKYIDEVPEKKIIFIVHGLSVMGMNRSPNLNSEGHLKILISYYVSHLNLFDIFLMPMANPDGYSAAHSIAIWNKNVSPQEACPGVALDRNFDVAWNSSRKISSCSQMYPGKAPFSEVESKAIRDIFHYHGHKILAYIHVHTGTYTEKVFKGEAILYPKGYTEVQSDDDKYIDLKGEIDEAMKNASFQVMSVTVDTLHNWYGKVAGTSVDYASTVYGIPYALEFVMQLYEEDDFTGTSHETHRYYALTEIWSRIIRTSFKNMWKSLHVNEVRRK